MCIMGRMELDKVIRYALLYESHEEREASIPLLSK